MKQDSDHLQIEIVLDALMDIGQPLPKEYLRTFSDISRSDLKAIRKNWEDIPAERKITLLTDLAVLMKEDTLILCDEFGKFALEDNNPTIRSRAIELLWECEEPNLARKYLNLLQHDPSIEVRIASASALGKFLLLGELDEIREDLSKTIMNTLLKIYQSGISEQLDLEILKSIGYSGDPRIIKKISDAFKRNSRDWQLAAIIAMGRSADPRWESEILNHIHDTHLPTQVAAIRAAGELNLKAARPELLEIFERVPEEDSLLYEIILALSKLGGSEARDALENRLAATSDEEEIEILQLALDTIDFEAELPDLDLE